MCCLLLAHVLQCSVSAPRPSLPSFPRPLFYLLLSPPSSPFLPVLLPWPFTPCFSPASSLPPASSLLPVPVSASPASGPVPPPLPFPSVLCVLLPLPVALKPMLESLPHSSTYTFPDFFSLPPGHSSLLVISLFYSSSAMPEKRSKCLFQVTNQAKIWDLADKIINHLSSIGLELTSLCLFFSWGILSDFISKWVYSDTDVTGTTDCDTKIANILNYIKFLLNILKLSPH